jgi:hypothetical protein
VHAAHHVGDFLAEAFLDLCAEARLDHAQLEQQAGDARLGIAAQQRQRARHAERESKAPWPELARRSP